MVYKNFSITAQRPQTAGLFYFNFRRGDTLWRVTAIDEHRTLVSMQADQEPEFWIPPIIGPLLIKHSFVSEVHETVDKLERLANAVVQ